MQASFKMKEQNSSGGNNSEEDEFETFDTGTLQTNLQDIWTQTDELDLKVAITQTFSPSLHETECQTIVLMTSNAEIQVKARTNDAVVQAELED
jgi:hypothetical protein